MNLQGFIVSILIRTVSLLLVRIIHNFQISVGTLQVALFAVIDRRERYCHKYCLLIEHYWKKAGFLYILKNHETISMFHMR